MYFSGIDVVEMKSHLYPEGGWGWIVCAAGFLALLLTTGMQLAFGILHLCALRHLGEHHMMDIGKFNKMTNIRSEHEKKTSSVVVQILIFGSPKTNS